MSLFSNPELVQDITESKNTLDMATNAGRKLINRQADIPEFGKVWFDEQAITNVFSLADITKRYKVTYDSSKDDAFIVHINKDHRIRFEKSPEGLYHYLPSEKYRQQVKGMSNLISTVKENCEGYMQRQFERAKRAQTLYHNMGAPSLENLKKLLQANTIQNCPITVEDVTLAEKIFGKDISTLKGKSTRPKLHQVKNDYIEIPKELLKNNTEITLCMDTMFVNRIGFLTTIDKTVRF